MGNNFTATRSIEEWEAEARYGTKHTNQQFPVYFLFWTNIFLFLFLQCSIIATLSVKLQLTGYYFSRNNLSGITTVLPLGTVPAEYPQIHLC